MISRMGEWLSIHWFDLVQSAGIMAALLFNVASLRENKTARRLSNLTTLIQNHREIWKDFATNPALGRMKERDVDLEREPVTREELTFVRFVIAHLFGAYEATRLNEVIGLEKLAQDAAQFLSYPIPNAVWNEIRDVQSQGFITFAESAMTTNHKQSSTSH